MHPILERARSAVDQAELYWNREHSITVHYENYRLQQVTENDVSETSLRVIKDGKIGTAYAVFPDQPGYLDNAVAGAQYGDPVQFSFAEAADVPQLENRDEKTAALTSADLVDACETIKAKVGKHLPDVALGIGASCSERQLIVQTTRGVDAVERATAFEYYVGAPFQGAGIGIYRSNSGTSPREIDAALLDEFVEWYSWGARTSTPSTGRLPVILAPQASFLLMMPLLAGVSGDAVWKKTSPLSERQGEQILSNVLTIADDPLRAGHVDARAFDDEGVPCARRVLVEGGVLKNFLFDLRFGAAMGVPSSGHGFKRTMFGSGNETATNPWLCCPAIEPGDASWRDFVAGMKEGLLVTGGMGFHSGNYPQGQFAVQAVGFHVVGGEIVGRLDKTMISGNIYQDGMNVGAVSRGTGPAGGFLPLGDAPYILIDSLQVAGK